MNSRKSKQDTTRHNIKRGAGKGCFDQYASPIKKYDLSSLGRKGSTYGVTVNRTYHFLSDLERNYFDIIDFKDSTIDIRENYPLLPIESTILIAETLGIPHPSEYGETKIMTSDFYILYKKDNEIKKAVRQIKYVKDLSDPRVLEKFVIEEYWWRQRGVTDWKVITERQVDQDLAIRIQDLKSYLRLDLKETFKDYSLFEIQRLVEEFKIELKNNPGEVSEIIESFDRKHNLPGGGIRIYKHLAALKEVQVDLSRDDLGIY